jgi:hypothetical protein
MRNAAGDFAILHNKREVRLAAVIQRMISALVSIVPHVLDVLLAVQWFDVNWKTVQVVALIFGVSALSWLLRFSQGSLLQTISKKARQTPEPKKQLRKFWLPLLWSPFYLQNR